MIPSSALGYLAAFEGDNELVVSLYLDVNGKQYSHIQNVERTHQLVRQVAHDLAASGASPEVQKSAQTSLDRIVRYIGTELERGDAQGLGLFCCEPLHLWQVFTLQVSVTDQIVLGPRPAIRQAAQILDAYPYCLVALVDQRSARLLTVVQGELRARVEMEDEVDRRVKPSTYYGLHDKRIERHVDEQISSHLRHAAQEIDALARELGPMPIIIGAPNDTAAQLERVLSQDSAGRVIAVRHISMDAPQSEIATAVTDEMFKFHKLSLDEAYAEARARAFSLGAGALGYSDTFRSLFVGAVDTLVIRGQRPAPGFECSQCGRLFMGSPDCPECGARAGRLSEDILEDAVCSACRQNAGVRVQIGEEYGLGEPTVGALLRFAVPHMTAPLPLSA